ncbi:hypothetical protein Cantr_08535 [Candida viswanathii]|uniref:Uncharacterized protein n=1 Tax=Candida viswanathii TaxID=5486 RepID=A0A367Y378_9ASCO|nr:hypothetical protein Cantr_08535 [Candida viswanathii]
MPASIREMKIHNKRKMNELEDISNTHKKSRIVSFKPLPSPRDNKPPVTRLKKYNNYVTPPSPPQQRSSPPAICLEDDDHHHHHQHHQHHDGDAHPSFPATPPESISDEAGNTPIAAATEEATTTSETPSLANASSTSATTQSPLNNNADYITLTSSLRMAKLKSTQINDEIIELSRLQNHYLSSDNKEETIRFFLKLIHNELHLPKPSNIIKSPVINWSKYHPSLAQVSKDFENQLKNGDKKEEAMNSLYKALNLFDKLK